MTSSHILWHLIFTFVYIFVSTNIENSQCFRANLLLKKRFNRSFSLKFLGCPILFNLSYILPTFISCFSSRISGALTVISLHLHSNLAKYVLDTENLTFEYMAKKPLQTADIPRLPTSYMQAILRRWHGSKYTENAMR